MTSVSFVYRSRSLQWISFIVCAMTAGFFLSFSQVINIDDHTDLSHGEWLLWNYGIGEHINIDGLWNIEKYGPLFDVVVAVLSKTIFSFLHNPFWVQRATIFAFSLGACGIVAQLLRTGGVGWRTIALWIALMIGDIRLGGHALLNQKDIPFAFSFLVTTVFLWHAIRQIEAKKKPDVRLIISTTLVCLVPFLCRPVPPMHLGIFYAYAIYASIRYAWKQRFMSALTMAVTPLVLVVIVLFAAFPMLWTTSLDQWKGQFTIFLSYPWPGTIRAFGQSFRVPDDTLPWWYVPAWIPVMMHPIALLFFSIGIIGSLYHVVHPTKSAPSFAMRIFGLPLVRCTLERWMWVIIVASWTAFFLVQPIVYDEERHLTFLYLPLITVAGMGLSFIPRRYQTMICTVIIVSALGSYVEWGRYSYVYKNPLFTSSQEDEFMGDYWGACTTKAILALPDVVPAGTGVSYEWVDKSGSRFLRTMETGLPLPNPALAQYPSENRKGSGHARILINRMETFESLTRDVTNGQATVVWRDDMPPGAFAACIILYYPPADDGSGDGIEDEQADE